MMQKKSSGFGEMDLDNIKQNVDGASKKKVLGRPKKNPYAQEKQLTVRMPAELHKRLDQYRVDTGQPMVATAVQAIMEFMDKNEITRR